MASQAALDLLWLVNSPSFVTGDMVAAPHRLNSAEIDEVHLGDYLADRPVYRVGRYFENLLQYWLSHIRGVEIEAAGRQILDGKRTIGEIDFLYRNETDQLVHCEASVKFFLHHPIEGQSHYPGPNASDNFELKTAKLFDQQLPLSEVYVPEVELREAFVKGIVFYHVTADEPGERPGRMAADHLRGEWLRASELDLLTTRGDVVCAVAEKPNWLAPPTGPAFPPETLASELVTHFAGPRPHPVMVSLRDPETLDERARLFVVSDLWPARSA